MFRWRKGSKPPPFALLPKLNLGTIFLLPISMQRKNLHFLRSHWARKAKQLFQVFFFSPWSSVPLAAKAAITLTTSSRKEMKRGERERKIFSNVKPGHQHSKRKFALILNNSFARVIPLEKKERNLVKKIFSPMGWAGLQQTTVYFFLLKSLCSCAYERTNVAHFSLIHYNLSGRPTHNHWAAAVWGFIEAAAAAET